MTDTAAPSPRTRVQRLLDLVEHVGNKPPDPAALFLIGMLLSWLLAEEVGAIVCVLALIRARLQ